MKNDPASHKATPRQEMCEKRCFLKKHPHFWAKNGETCVFGLKTATKKRKNEQIRTNMNTNAHKCAQISIKKANKERRISGF